jgi:hypothetical protein
MRHLSGCLHVCVTARVLGVECDLEAQYEPDGKATALVAADFIAFGGTYLDHTIALDIDSLPESEREDLDRIVNTAHNERDAVEPEEDI